MAAVTGGAGGIGLAITRRLLADGWAVAVADLDPAALAALAAELGPAALPSGEGKAGATTFRVDVTDSRAMLDFVAGAERALGSIDVFVNNAGVMTVGPFLEQDEAVIRRQFDVNVFGVINGLRAVLPPMLGRRRGHVITIASAASRVGIPGEATYTATKHAVFGLCEALRSELRGTGVQLSVVMPGVVETPLAAGTRTSRGVRRLQPDEVAQAVLRTIAKPRFEVYVPRSLAVPVTVAGLLPRRLRDRLARLSGADRVAMGADLRSRRAYEDALLAQTREPE